MYPSLQVREELITQVDMGPFKHKIDSGLRLRKVAFASLVQLARAAAAPATTAAAMPQLPLATIVKALALGIVDPSDEVQPLACELMGTVAESLHCWKPQEVVTQ